MDIRQLSSESLIETDTSLKDIPVPENILIFRIIVVGSKGVGKTSISRHFTERQWLTTPCEDRGIEYRPCYRFYNEKKDFVKFLIVDVPCAEVVKYYNSGYLRGILGGVIMFDLSDRASLDEALDWDQ